MPPHLSPLALSLLVSFCALALVVPVGAWLGYLLARRRGGVWSVVDLVVLLPLVMPPTVVGYGLLGLFGREGLVGALLARAFGLTVAFTPLAAIVAAAVVALPLMVKTAQVAFARVDAHLEEMALVDGATRLQALARVTVPLATPGLLAGSLLAFARGLGELGATLIFAGNIPGRTSTLPLAILLAHEAGNSGLAASLSWTLGILGAAIALAVQRLSQRVAAGDAR